jgi:hypothetical protein
LIYLCKSKNKKKIMVINNELKFAEKVILIDASYINKVTGDLSQHFGQMIGRELPKADLPIFLECVAMDAAIQPGENVLQVLLVYDKELTKMDAFNPGDLKKELNDVAFKSQLGEFQLNTFEPSDMADREAFFLEAVKLVADAKEVKHLVIVPSETEYGDKIPEILEKVDGKESIHVLGMNPLAPSKAFSWEMMGYAVLQALGVRSDEI